MYCWLAVHTAVYRCCGCPRVHSAARHSTAQGSSSTTPNNQQLGYCCCNWGKECARQQHAGGRPRGWTVNCGQHKGACAVDCATVFIYSCDAPSMCVLWCDHTGTPHTPQEWRLPPVWLGPCCAPVSSQQHGRQQQGLATLALLPTPSKCVCPDAAHATTPTHTHPHTKRHLGNRRHTWSV